MNNILKMFQFISCIVSVDLSASMQVPALVLKFEGARELKLLEKKYMILWRPPSTGTNCLEFDGTYGGPSSGTCSTMSPQTRGVESGSTGGQRRGAIRSPPGCTSTPAEPPLPSLAKTPVRGIEERSFLTRFKGI